jgi:hypothetical protein
MKKMYRQGDVMLVRDDNAHPTGEKEKPVNGRVILAYGEATGHHHSLDCQVADLFGGDKPVLVVKEPTTLDHQEHANIEVAPGIYWVTRQREYTPSEIVRVRD